MSRLGPPSELKRTDSYVPVAGNPRSGTSKAEQCFHRIPTSYRDLIRHIPFPTEIPSSQPQPCNPDAFRSALPVPATYPNDSRPHCKFRASHTCSRARVLRETAKRRLFSSNTCPLVNGLRFQNCPTSSVYNPERHSFDRGLLLKRGTT